MLIDKFGDFSIIQQHLRNKKPVTDFSATGKFFIKYFINQAIFQIHLRLKF